uniref:Uncharacterized protein n=1 Tax=Biomphalaria glabrata TaxID=6526 RepID=A0A2C9K873_BIOGL
MSEIDLLLSNVSLPKLQKSSATPLIAAQSTRLSRLSTKLSKPSRNLSSGTSLTINTNVADAKKSKIVVWPEWNDADVNAEKWKDGIVEATKRDDKKGKSPVVQFSTLYEDPDGRLEMPPSVKVDHWKRPADFITDRVPVVVDTEHIPEGIDLLSQNGHLDNSEMLRYCISQITALWDMHTVKPTNEAALEATIPGDDPTHSWQPWGHIYSLCKAGKGPHLPLYNNYGKYVVKIYWMGCWRKVYIDDLMPFDENDNLLLPASALKHELWPMLLAKALIKVASLDYSGGNQSQEFGDMTVIHTLTGWIPEAIPLHVGITRVTPEDMITQWRCLIESFLKPQDKKPGCFPDTPPPPLHSYMKDIWELMRNTLPEWKLPLQEWEKKKEPTDIASLDAKLKDDKAEQVPKEAKDAKGDKSKAKAKDVKGKDKDKEKASKGKEKDRQQTHSSNSYEEKPIEDFVMPEKPEIVMFASYSNTPKYPVKVSVLGEMADASETLRQNGLSHLFSHPVYLSQTRSCPLEPPPPPIVIPAWKLIRPRKKKSPPHDEPVVIPEPPKEIRCIEIASLFVNYKVSNYPIPTDTHRPKSALERGGARSRSDNENRIDEKEENSIPPQTEAVVETEPDKAVEEKSLAEDIVIPSTKRRQSVKKLLKNLERSGSKADSVKTVSRLEEHKSKETINLNAALESQSSQPQGNSAPPDVEEEPAKEPIIKKTWMDFDTFYKCFKTLYIFHKANTYPWTQRHSDYKISKSNPVELHVEKPPSVLRKTSRNVKDDTMVPATATTVKSEKKVFSSPMGSSDSSTSYYLFVDNLNPTDILVSYSVIPRWFDPPVVYPEEKKMSISKSAKERDGEKLEKELTNLSLGEQFSTEIKPPPVVTPGTLVAEPYSWKSLVTGQPILRLKTTGTKAAMLSLPAGRHVLKFMMSSNLGHHVHMCSTANFTFGDEETIMPMLTAESCRFKDNAINIIQNLNKCINSFTDTLQFQQAWDMFVESHCPFVKNKQFSKTQHFQIFNESFYAMLRKTLKDMINAEVAFAWRAFNFDAVTPNILGHSSASSRPELRQFSPPPLLYESRAISDDKIHADTKGTSVTSVRSSAKPLQKKRGGNQSAVLPDSTSSETDVEKNETNWTNSLDEDENENSASPREMSKLKQPTVEELVAAVKIQKVWRGYFTRKLKKARVGGTELNAKVFDTLSRCLTIIEANSEENGLFLLREIFKRNPDIMAQYPFFKDEWNKICYADYKGAYTEQPSMSWFIVFRDIFYVKEETLVVPKLYVPINTCLLRVIDNDTYQEIPRVFQKVAPYIYKKNKKGYSFVAEARTIEQPLTPGNWRMRLIGSLSPLPAPQTQDVCCSFITKEIRDYYIPNPKNIILRQSVKVAEDHFASLQLNTSKPDAYIKLAVLDNEEEIISAVGQGHVVIPAFTFLKDITQEDLDNRRASSRASLRGSNNAISAKADKPSRSKRTESVTNAEQSPPSRSSMRSDAELAERLEDSRPHKYVIQATVLQNSWPLSESAWRFVQMLKEMEKNDLKVSNRPLSSPKLEKTPIPKQSSKPKVGKEKGAKEKEKGQESRLSRPPSQTFDLSKPHWTLRVVSDTFAAEEIEIKKDTERADEIRAMKKAWEEAEPGRAAKALQSRLAYLNSHAVKIAQPAGELSGGVNAEHPPDMGYVNNDQELLPPLTPNSLTDMVESEVNLTLEPPSLAYSREVIEPLDLTPFIKKTLPEPKYLDEFEQQKLLEQRQQEIAEYKAFREKVEQWRELDRQLRNKAKIQQLKQCQALQAAIDAAREKINIPREAIRQKFLEAEKHRLEEEEKLRNALKAEQDVKTAKAPKKSAKKK